MSIQTRLAKTQVRPQVRQDTVEVFESLLRDRSQYPERAAEIDTRIRQTFAQTRSVWILDSAGFSRKTEQQGIIPALLNIYQMRKIVTPLIAKHGGQLLKAEADNIYVTFPNADQAVSAAGDVLDQLNAAGLSASVGIGHGEVLVVGGRDVFGHEMNLASKLGEDLAGHNEILLTAAAFANCSSNLETDPSTVEISGLALNVYRVLHEG